MRFTNFLSRPRTLWFDIDGTLVHETFGRAKRALAEGRFEDAVRAAEFDRIVCVSDAATIARANVRRGKAREPHEVVFDLMRGTARDYDWFREEVELVDDPSARGAAIDEETDWYFVDDYAARYLMKAGRGHLLRHGVREGRVLTCRAASEGEEVRAWLDALAPTTAGTPSSLRIA